MVCFFHKRHARACSCVDGSKLGGERGELMIFVKRTSLSRASNKDEMPALVGCSRSWNQEPPGFDPAARGGPMVMATSWLHPPRLPWVFRSHGPLHAWTCAFWGLVAVFPQNLAPEQSAEGVHAHLAFFVLVKPIRYLGVWGCLLEGTLPL